MWLNVSLFMRLSYTIGGICVNAEEMKKVTTR